ncbi:MAG: hypothetical protein ACE5JM_15110 [Armatimonadota bacterium]
MTDAEVSELVGCPAGVVGFLRSLGWEVYGEPGSHVAMYVRDGPVALIDPFVVHPTRRDGKFYKRVFWNFVEVMRHLGVRRIVALSSTHAALWERLGGQRQGNYLSMRL